MPVLGDGPAHFVTDDDLVYSARARCDCGAGLAHLRGVVDPTWDCSAILTGRAVPHGAPGWRTHVDRLPDRMVHLVPERRGFTTRPVPESRRLIVPLGL